jgi:kynurenine formamidase
MEKTTREPVSDDQPLTRNWGRWGDDDERGALNLLSPDRILVALGRPRSGTSYRLGTSIGKKGIVSPGRNTTWHVTTTVEDPSTPGSGRAEDVVAFHTHAHTHIDGLAHSWFDGMVYNGRPSGKAVGRGGSNLSGVEKYGPIIGTALLLDVTVDRPDLAPGDVVGADDLARAADRADIDPHDADIVLVRVGWTEKFWSDHRLFESGAPGLGADAAEWIAGLDPAVVGMDNSAIEPVPSPAGVHPLTVHRRFLHDLGVPLIESLALAEPAAAGVTSGLFVALPLPIDRGLGSPLDPVLVV